MTTREQLDNLISKNYKKYLSWAKNNENGNDNPKDVLHECLLEILEFPEEKQSKLINYFDGYLLNMLKYSSRSNTSRYQQKHNIQQPKPQDFIQNIDFQLVDDCEFDGENIFDILFIENETTIKITVDDIFKILYKEFDYYDREVFLRKSLNYEIYKQLIDDTGIYSKKVFKSFQMKHIPKDAFYKTFQKFSDETKIPKSSLWLTYQKVKKTLQEKIYLLYGNK